MAHKFCLAVALVAALLTSAIRLAAADETNLIFATTEPAGSDDSMRVFSPWADGIGKATNGTFHIDLREGFAIANSTNIYDRGPQADVVRQVGILIPSLIGGKFPLTDVSGLPFLTDDAVNASAAFWRLYKTGALDTEYKDIAPLGFGLFPPQDVQLSQGTADARQSARAAAARRRQAVERVGRAPRRNTAGHRPQQRSIHGARTAYASTACSARAMSMGPLHLTDVTGYHIETSLGTGMFIVFMAHGKFASLPAATQQAILANSGESS